MAISYDSLTRQGSVTIVRVSSDLVGSPVFFLWYLDGAFISQTTAPSVGGTATSHKGFNLEQGDQVRLDVIDTLDPTLNVITAAPAGFPARRTLQWTRSLDVTASQYRIDQQKDSDPVTTIGLVRADATTWQYRFLSPRLVDLSTYQWTVVPLDEVGNAGVGLTIGPELIVRTPDAPAFSIVVMTHSTDATIQFVAA